MVHQSYHVGRQFPSWALDPREVKTWPCKKECVNVQRGAIANSQSVGARTPVGEEGKRLRYSHALESYSSAEREAALMRVQRARTRKTARRERSQSPGTA